MENHIHAERAGVVTSKRDEAHGSPQSAGPIDNQTLYLNPTVKLVPLQAVTGEISIFARLSQQFALLGLNLYPLDGNSVLVVSKILPDLRAAQVYVRQIGRVR